MQSTKSSTTGVEPAELIGGEGACSHGGLNAAIAAFYK
jgi:hypothetical protein